VSVGARVLIRLGAIRHNFQLIKERARDARIMAVIKANGYGHGMLQVTQCLDDVDCLAIARLTEAEQLRAAGIETPIALLTGVLSEEDLPRALELDLQLAVHTAAQIDWLDNYGKANATIWLKIDTGMNRLGFRPHEATEMIARVQQCAAVSELKLMTHFASADDVEDRTTASQIARFSEIADAFDGDISIANSAAIFAWQDELDAIARNRGDGRLWVRPGLALYGISPFPDKCGADLGLSPAMRFESRLVAVKPLRKGEGVGYGGTWHSGRDTMLGIVAAGYGDGYTRFIPAGSPIIVNGRRVKIAGLVSMDLTAVDLGPEANDQPGDPVLLWGDELPVEEVAIHAGTIPYQLVCGVSHRESCVFED
jgi:alanine racemase